MKRLMGKGFTGNARFARFAKSARGAIAVEAAFALPVILAAFFILCELAHMVLTVEIAETAVNAALVRFRADGTHAS